MYYLITVRIENKLTNKVTVESYIRQVDLECIKQDKVPIEVAFVGKLLKEIREQQNDSPTDIAILYMKELK